MHRLRNEFGEAAAGSRDKSKLRGLAVATLTAGLGFVALIGAGCAMMQSTLTDVQVGADKVVCQSNAGSYFLPKTIFRVGIVQRTTGTAPNERSYYELSYLVAVRRSDGTKPYCLDYLASTTSDDEINVVKYSNRLIAETGDDDIKKLADAKAKLRKLVGNEQLPDELIKRVASLEDAHAQLDSNLLRYVASDAVDQTSYVIQTLVKALFLGVAGAGANVKSAGLAPADQRVRRVVEHDFDPFDPLRTAVINDSLREFGFCVVVAGVTFDASATTVQKYCDDPMRQIRSQSGLVKKLEAARLHNEVKEVRGILYRPRIPYKVLLFLKSDLSKTEGWLLRKSDTIAMENIAPIISIGVDRTFFAQRKTALVFDQGTLTNVCIYKTSELQKFAEVPLEVVKAVVSLPSAVVSLRIIDTNNETQLVKVHQAVLAKQDGMLDQIAKAKAGLQSVPKELLTNTASQLLDADISPSEFFKQLSADSKCPTAAPAQ